jgi:hypothetical protein
LRNFLKFFWIFSGFLGDFFRFFLDFFWRNFFGGFFREDFFGGFFWRNFLGGFFLGGFFGRIFLGGFFWEDFLGMNSLFTLLKSAKLFESERD